MPNFTSLSITIRPCILFSSTIIGFARVKIDNEILLKEIPLFHNAGNLSVIIAANQVAMCSMEFDMDILNNRVWQMRERIEVAIVEEWKRTRELGDVVR